jgi:hypothetical protein
MQDALATYLHDHLAGAALAVDLLDSMRRKYSGNPLGNFAGSMLAEIKVDREVLQGIADRVGTGSSHLKDWSAWVAEKVSRLKLGRDPESLGAFEALEFLQVGISGKLLLWHALSAIAPEEERLPAVDFAGLIARAQAQYEQMGRERLALVRETLVPREGRSSKST